MKIKFTDFEAFLEYYYKQQSQGELPSDEINVSFDEKEFNISVMISFLDSEANLCKVYLHDTSTKMEPKLVKEMILHTRLGKKEN
jgi:hypothetical protein